MTRTYVVTGAASGIGKTLAERLIQEGSTVIGVDLHNTDVNVDLTTDEGRTALVEQVTEISGGKIDGIAALAGLAAPIPATVGVNYFGMIATLEGLRPLLAGSSAPRAALAASEAILDPSDEELVKALADGDEDAALARAAVLASDTAGSNPIYSSTKIAIALWTKKNAPTDAWAGASIPLNAIAPGLIATPMINDILATEEGRAALVASAPSPLNGPVAPATAPAALLHWLISEENTHVTGQIIFIDGGGEAIRRPDMV